MLSKAAKEERAAISDLEDAERAISRAHAKLRADTTGTVMRGMLSAAVTITEHVSAMIDKRTKENT